MLENGVVFGSGQDEACSDSLILSPTIAHCKAQSSLVSCNTHAPVFAHKLKE